MTTYASLLAAGADICEHAGYRIERPNRGWLPDAIATPLDDTDAVSLDTRSTRKQTAERTESDVSERKDESIGGDGAHGVDESDSTIASLLRASDSPLAIEPLDASDIDPTTVISRLWNNSNNGRRTLFVVPGGDADALATTVVELLSSPTCVASEDDTGCRTFYNSPDRVALLGGGYALHKSADADFQWYEEIAEETTESASVESENTRSGSDGRRIVLVDGADKVAVFDDVDDLACPPATAFPYSYRRNPRDKCFHVTNDSGREVGVFTDIRSLRSAAYEPIPMPFVPEHLFDGSVRSLWSVLVDDDEPRLYTADVTCCASKL